MIEKPKEIKAGDVLSYQKAICVVTDTPLDGVYIVWLINQNKDRDRESNVRIEAWESHGHYIGLDSTGWWKEATFLFNITHLVANCYEDMMGHPLPGL